MSPATPPTAPVRQVCGEMLMVLPRAAHCGCLPTLLKKLFHSGEASTTRAHCSAMQRVPAALASRLTRTLHPAVRNHPRRVADVLGGPLRACALQQLPRALCGLAQLPYASDEPLKRYLGVLLELPHAQAEHCDEGILDALVQALSRAPAQYERWVSRLCDFCLCHLLVPRLSDAIRAQSEASAQHAGTRPASSAGGGAAQPKAGARAQVVRRLLCLAPAAPAAAMEGRLWAHVGSGLLHALRVCGPVPSLLNAKRSLISALSAHLTGSADGGGGAQAAASAGAAPAGRPEREGAQLRVLCTVLGLHCLCGLWRLLCASVPADKGNLDQIWGRAWATLLGTLTEQERACVALARALCGEDGRPLGLDVSRAMPNPSPLRLGAGIEARLAAEMTRETFATLDALCALEACHAGVQVSTVLAEGLCALLEAVQLHCALLKRTSPLHQVFNAACDSPHLPHLRAALARFQSRAQ